MKRSSEKISVAKNYIYNTAYEVLLLLLPLVTTPYVSRVLGATNIGIYSYTTSILSYFVLFGRIGMDMYGTRTIACYQADEAARSKVFFEMAMLQACTIGISIAAYCLILLTSTEYQTYYLILLMALAASALDFSWLFRGLERFGVIVARNAIIRLLCAGAIFILVKSSGDLGIYMAIYAVSILGSNLFLIAALRGYIKYQHITMRGMLEHFLPAFRLFVPRIAISIYVILDKTMIKWITKNVAEVAYYTQGEKIVKLLLTVITSLSVVMMPRAANAFAQQDYSKVRAYAVDSARYVLLLAVPMLFGVIGVVSNFVPLFFGNGYEKVIPVMFIISPILLIIGLTSVLGTQFLIPTKQERKYTLSVLAGALSNIALNLLLISKYASVGAAIATVVAEFVVLLMQMYFVRNELPVAVLLKPSLKYLLGGFVMLGFIYTAGRVIHADRFAVLTAQVLIGLVVYAVYLIIIRDESIFALTRKIREKIRRE